MRAHKKGALWQPQARSVRLRRRSVKPNSALCTVGVAPRRLWVGVSSGRSEPVEAALEGARLWQECGVEAAPQRRRLAAQRQHRRRWSAVKLERSCQEHGASGLPYVAFRSEVRERTEGLRHVNPERVWVTRLGLAHLPTHGGRSPVPPRR